MVSKASRLLAKGEKIVFETENGTVEYIIKPMKNKELLEITDRAEEVKRLTDSKNFAESKKLSKALTLFMLKSTLIKDDPEITDNDLEEMSAVFTIKLLKKIVEVNGLEGLIDFQVGGKDTPQQTSSPALNSESPIQAMRERVAQAKHL